MGGASGTTAPEMGDAAARCRGDNLGGGFIGGCVETLAPMVCEAVDAGGGDGRALAGARTPGTFGNDGGGTTACVNGLGAASAGHVATGTVHPTSD